MPTPQLDKAVEKRFDELTRKFYGEGGSKLDCFECEDSQDLDKIKQFLAQELEAQKQEIVEMIKKIEETFGGCYCGYHGYLVLPDCDEEDHGDKCASCLLKRIKGA